jgi:Domain of unknown function (DUF3291)
VSGYELAQLNIGIIRGPIDSPVMAEFVANLDRINALAKSVLWWVPGGHRRGYCGPYCISPFPNDQFSFATSTRVMTTSCLRRPNPARSSATRL